MGEAVTADMAAPRRQLPPPPTPEPKAYAGIDLLAPKFRDKFARVVFRMGTKGWHLCVRESRRTDERQTWLFKCGREYDDGRGIVTNVPTARKGWHFFDLAVDVGDSRYAPGAEPEHFWTDLMECVEAEGLESGYDWDRDGVPVPKDPDEHFCDRPHVQWWVEGMHVSPSPHASELYDQGGREAVWDALEAR